MWRCRATLLAAIAVGLGILSAPAAAGTTGQVIVRYAPGVDGEERTVAREEADVKLADSLLLPRTQLVEPESGQSVTEAVAALEEDPRVLHAEPDRMATLDATPDDPRLPSLWGLLNAGQSVQGISGTPGADIDAKAGWDIGRTSANTITAVIDSGITADHPDLASQVWTNPGEIAGNGIDDDANGFVDDVHGWDFVDGDSDVTDGSRHGSHVAGIIGATGNNGEGISGVSWDANLMPVRVCGSVGGCPVSAVIDGIVYATEMGAKVVNMSLGSSYFSSSQRDAIAAANDTLFVTSAGNEANDGPGLGDNDVNPKYPCMADQAPGNPPLRNLICVASTDQDDARSNFSNWGATSVDLAAPGSNIVSTVPDFANPFVDTFSPAGTLWDYAKVDLGQSPTAGGWERNENLGQEGVGDYAVTDSFGTNYAPNSTAIMNTTGSGIDLSGREACGLIYFLSLSTHRPNPASLVGADILYVEASGNATGPWTTLDRWAGSTGGYQSSATLASDAALDPFAGDPSVFVRFRLVANGDANVGSGASIDDVAVRCAVPSPDLGHVNYLNGTSMATPQVAGIASIVRDMNPGLFPAEVKSKILDGVDVLPAFSGASPTPLVTGGRANLRNTLSSLDLTPPPQPMATGPEGVIGNPRPGFTWSVGEATAKYELLIDGAPIVSGTGLGSYTPLADFDLAEHTWQVRASDRPGNVSLSEARTFRYAPPVVVKVAGAVKVLSIKPFRRGKGGSVARLRVSAAGTVRAVARWHPGKLPKPVARGSKRTGRAGAFTLKLSPTRAGRVALRGRKLLKARFEFNFRPGSGGAADIAERAGKLAAPPAKRHR